MRRFNWRSGSNNSSESTSAKDNRNLKKRNGRKSTKRRNASALRLEVLERRELMAADILHNDLISQDVNGDFRVTALDALNIINHINAANRAAARGGAEGEATTTNPSKPLKLDVNDDSRVSALDLLGVVNKLSTRAEGEDMLAEVKQIAVGPDGQELPFVMVNNVKEYNIGIGQQFSLRTQVLDNRNNIGETTFGVFGARMDIEYSNTDSSTQETVQALYGEFLSIDINNATGGSFRLSFDTPNGTQETGNIVIAASNNQTNNNIRDAIAALPFVGGVSNIDMLPPLVTGNTVNYALNFVNQLIRTDVSTPVVTNSVISGTNPSVVPTSTFDPSRFSVFLSAMGFPVNELPESGLSINYDFFTSGVLKQTPTGGYLIDEVGGTNDVIGQDYNEDIFVSVFDVRFRGSVVGTVEFTTNGAEGEGVYLLGSDEQGGGAVPNDLVQFSSPIRVNVIDRIQAVDDTYPVDPGVILEDSGQTTLTNLTGNDVVLVGVLAGITAVTQPAAGTGTVTFTPGSNNVNFTPGANFFGQTTFTYTVANSLGHTSVGTVTVNVTGVNDPPILITPAPAAPSIGEDSATPLTVAASTFFLPGPGGETGAVRFNTAVLVNAGTGSVTINGNGELVYSPAANFFGAVPVRVTAIDAQSGVSQTVTIQLNVTPVNDVPVALGPTFSTDEDTQLTLTAAQLFTPGPANESTQTVTLANVALTQGQANATISISNGQVVVVPANNFFGTLVFAVDGTDNGSPALTTRGTFTVTVAPVNDPPTAVADSYVVVSSTGTAQELKVLDNDSAGPGETNDDLRITRILNHTGAGTVQIAANGRSIFYTPAAGQVTGSDTFTYEISDSTNAAIAKTAQAQVNIDIVPPVLPFAVRDNRSIVEGTASTTIDVMANDLTNTGATRSLVSFTQPASGTVTRDDNGTPANTSDDKLIFTPLSTDFFGEVTFQYVLDDDAANSNPSTGTVTVLVTEVNDAPTVVANQNATTTEDAVDFQIAGATLLAGSTAGPLETTQTVSLQSARVLSGGGSVAVRNGNLFYTAATNFVGNAVVEFTAVDNGTTNGVADPKTAVGRVTIAITPVNDAPITADDTATTAEDTTVDIPFSAVLGNDRPGPANAADELQNQQLTVTAVSVLSGGGTASIVGNNIRFVPASNANGQVVLQYTIRDSENTPTAGFNPLTATGRVTVTVTETNDAPANFTASRSVYAGLPTNINLAAELAATSRGAANEASQTLKINRIIPGSVQGGTATLNADGTVTFTATEGSSGTAGFEVETIDNGTTKGVADPKTGRGTVTINVSPFQPSSVSGYVWIDDDFDGGIDIDEHMVGGVTVTLKGTTIAEGNNAYENTVVTGADGSFSFDVLPPGNYTVSYKNPNGTVDGALPNEVSYNVSVPGGKNLVTNFNVRGVNVALSSVLDNLVEGYYNSHPNARGKGVDAVINADGSMAFSSVHGGYSNVRFAEVILTNGGRDAVLSIVGEDMSVRTAIIPRGKYFITRDDAGVTYVRIVALESELSFFTSGSAPVATAQSSNYLDSVDSYFANFS